MTMTMDNTQRHHISMGYDQNPYSAPTPQFTNPWSSANSHFSSALGATTLDYSHLPKSQSRTTTMSMPYSSVPASAPPIGSGNYPNLPYSHSDLLSSSELLNSSRSAYDPSFSAATTQASTSYAPQPAAFAPMASYGQSLAQHQQQQQESNRRLSHSSTIPISQAQTNFDAMDGARGMVAMSQDITPRNIYGPRGDRGSTDSYGFPSTHSSTSSISSASSYPQYYAGSTDSSVTDYSSASESMEPMTSRTLPRPTGLIGTNIPPAPQSMMGSFNSKISSSTQKKHKCKVCDKRFTRPSSLQTHMYSHTGEKPFSCEVQGCGRNFSVVSNLRRHRKVHKGDNCSDHGSPEGSWASSDK